MSSRTPRTILATSTVLALSISILTTSGAFARGPGGSASSCDGDCAVDQTPSQQQIRARDGSGAQAQTRSRDGGGWQVQAGQGLHRGPSWAQGGPADMARWGQGAAQRGPADGAPCGPEACSERQFEMGTLTDEQMATLRFMANEEKLAHDVYLALGELYDLPVFEGIAASEAQHQAAVNTLLERYGIDG
jgi:hypothetical protein